MRVILTSNQRSFSTLLAFFLALALFLWRLNSPFSINQSSFNEACLELGDQCQAISEVRLLDDVHPSKLPLVKGSQTRSDITVELPIYVPQSGLKGGPGLCIPRSAFLNHLRVDGLPIQYTGQPIRNKFLRPLHVRFISELAPGRHTISLNLTAPAGLEAGLSTGWFGSDPIMAAQCQSMSEQIRDRSHNITWVMAALGIISFLLWYRLGDPLTLTFCALSLSWVLHLWVVTVSSQDTLTSWWSPIFFGTRVLFVLPMIWFVLQLSNRKNQAWSYALICFLCAGLLSLLLFPSQRYFEWLYLVACIAFGLCLYLASKLMIDLWKKPSWTLYLTAVCFAFVVTTNAHDFAHWTTTGGYGSLASTYLSVPILCIAFGYQLVMKLIEAAEQRSRLAEKYREEVEIQKRRIESDVEKIQQQREQLAVLQERRRLVRDMHDGLGSRLMAISARLKNPTPLRQAEVEGLLDDSIQELRSVLDILSIESVNVDDDDPISSLLGTLRWRMAPALEAKGVHLSWSCDVLPPAFLTRDDQRLNLIRFWQEAFTNVLKHSQARQAFFKVTQSGASISMELRDNGKGFTEIQGHGIGFKSMTVRAEAIGGQFEYSSKPMSGTTLRLIWLR
jgi:signal transduction histidine kinase